MAVRLKDIADEMGLSVVTISKVLRDHPDIGSETRKRVMKRIRELNYQPNLAARALVSGKTWTMGIVVPGLLHPFFANIANTVSTIARKKGYSLLISSSNDDPALEVDEIKHMLARRVDVIIVASAQSSADSFRQIEQEKVPYILFDRQIKGLEANFVGVDDVAAGKLATSHLIEQGCRRVAHIRGPEVSTAIGRLDGYRQVLASYGLTPLPEHIVSLGLSGDHLGEKSGYEAAQRLLAANPLPDGIFCYNDTSALGAMRALLEAGLRIPEDIAIIGCSNLSFSDFLRVPLSTVDQGSESIGKCIGELAIVLASRKIKPRPKIELIAPHIVVRASSQRTPVPAVPALVN